MLLPTVYRYAENVFSSTILSCFAKNTLKGKSLITRKLNFAQFYLMTKTFNSFSQLWKHQRNFIVFPQNDICTHDQHYTLNCSAYLLVNNEASKKKIGFFLINTNLMGIPIECPNYRKITWQQLIFSLIGLCGCIHSKCLCASNLVIS